VPVVDRERVIAALPGYTVGEEIGGGGSGVVLAGHHRDLDRAVAIKVLSTPTENPAAVNGFRTEARLLSRLDHPHIVRIHDFVARDGLFLLVMELLPGGSLGRQTLSMPGVCAVGLAVADALSRAHALGVLHRDLKPDNILFSRLGQPKLTDFGIAKIFDWSADVASRVVGSPRYMAPEQIARDRLVPATDLYALGVVLYELFSGAPMFGADLPLPRLLQHHAEVVPPPPSGLPEPLARVVLRALEKDPGARPGSAGEFAAELAAAARTVFGDHWVSLSGVPVQISDEYRKPSPAGAPTGQVTHRSAGPPAPMVPPTPSDRAGAGYPPDAVTRLGVGRPADAPPAAGAGGPARPGGRGAPAQRGGGGAGGAGGRRHDLPPLPPPPVEAGPGGFRPGGYRPEDGPGPDTTGSRPTGRARLRRWWPAAAGVLAVIAVVGYLVVPGGSDGGPGPAPAVSAVPGAEPVPPNADGQAQLPSYDSLAVDPAGTIYLADWKDNEVQRIDSKRDVTVVAGGGAQGSSGDGGPALAAALSGPKAAVVDGKGNLYIADEGNDRIRRVNPRGVITPFAGTGDQGSPSGDGGPATQAALVWSNPVMAVGSHGDLYVSGLYSVRRIDAAGKITTVVNRAGQQGSSGDGGPAADARLNMVTGLAVDGAGNLYIADGGANRIRKVDTNGIITTLAGTGAKGYSGDGGPAAAARLNDPEGVAVDAAGNVYIADNLNNGVRKVTPDGTITTIAGTGVPGGNNDDGPAKYAQLWGAAHVAVDAAGNVYIGETGRILEVDRSGKIEVIAVSQ
jgi:sugar lactone lactonase YvrE